ncbi:MAG: SprT-like domain-containing protein, partial [Gemmatimonadetes bacterium]|nr:SprT-like domain-containing protein [Gemmatimonadota bacterium]
GEVLNVMEDLAHEGTTMLVVTHEMHFAREAADRVRTWPGVEEGLRRARASHRRRRAAKGRCRPRRDPGRPGPCCATPEQRRYLRHVYRYLNRTRFAGRLPERIPLRLSNRMRSRLGQMVPGVRGGKRIVIEIALNVDLMLQGNGRERMDTLLHEMAHAADWLVDGHRDHGETWRWWARAAGCRPVVCSDSPIIQRLDHSQRVTRVPPLPLGAREMAA